MSDRVTVLIIDDSAFNRRSLRHMLESSPDIKVVGAAIDGEDGLKKASALRPDVVTLDLEMPRMDGFTFLRILMRTNPIPTLVISSKSDSESVFTAMELGAVDFIQKPVKKASMELYSIKEDVLKKVLHAQSINLKNVQRRIADINVKLNLGIDTSVRPIVKIRGAKREDFEVYTGFKLIAIGSSTGGPSALQRIVSGLDSNLKVSVLISQHMPAGFTNTFAQRLNKYTNFTVREAQDGDPIRQGSILLCPGGYSMEIKTEDGRKEVRLLPRQKEDKFIPSVNRMFASAAKEFGRMSVGVVLTGMGDDGKKGIETIKDSGGYTIAESEETAVIFGMPREAIATGKIDRVLPYYLISMELNRWAKG
ncbi:MAG: chemotaxis-specific protein-glutamate methyltransferase CheB [Deltaproteobacteria bacterium]|nr:chemotaxis-specific protein-glutamate methyltransferase CheB [Deltaproteobacteria bacterium]MCL5276733.1 chemotaxis-specific protein-glutamate methyltransferase CheB [Deltaproteobacteria bacterium]